MHDDGNVGLVVRKSALGVFSGSHQDANAARSLATAVVARRDSRCHVLEVPNSQEELRPHEEGAYCTVTIFHHSSAFTFLLNSMDNL